MTLKVRKVQMGSLAVDEGCRLQSYVKVEVISQVHQAEASWNNNFNHHVPNGTRSLFKPPQSPSHPIRESRRPMKGGDD